MKKVFFNLVVAIVVFVAFLSAISAGGRTGNYWGGIVVFFAASLYLLLEWPSRKGSSLSSVQYGVTHTLIGFFFMTVGIFTIWQGFSEFTKPVIFSRSLSNLVIQVIRDTFGSIGVSVLLWLVGYAIAIIGVRLLRFSPKPSNTTNSVQSPNSSVKRRAPDLKRWRS